MVVFPLLDVKRMYRSVLAVLRFDIRWQLFWLSFICIKRARFLAETSPKLRPRRYYRNKSPPSPEPGAEQISYRRTIATT